MAEQARGPIEESPLRVLLSEDSPDDELLIRRQLTRSEFEVDLTRVVTEDEFIRELGRNPDVVLADHSLPDFDAARALELVQELSPSIPVIVVSGKGGEENAVAMMQAGAEDYLLKDRLARLGPAILAAVERRTLRADAERQRARARAVAEQLPGAVWATDLDLVLTFVSGRSLVEVGLDPEVLIGRSLREDPLLGDDSELMVRAHEEALRGEPQDLEAVVGDRAFVVHVAPVRDPSGAVQGVVSAALDVTERLEGEALLQESLTALRRTDEQRRRLLLRLARAQEEERRRIAEGIHDDSIQFISAGVIRLSTFRRRLGETELAVELGEVEETLSLGIERLRRMIFELRPSLLDRSGLAATLREYAESLGPEERIGDFAVEDRMTQEPPGDIRAALYRLILEALRNAQRHSRASRVEVLLENREGGVAATVSDDGVGFDTEVVEQAAGHLGLTSMRERAVSLGGWVRISSSTGGGTTVEIWVPAAESPERSEEAGSP